MEIALQSQDFRTEANKPDLLEFIIQPDKNFKRKGGRRLRRSLEERAGLRFAGYLTGSWTKAAWEAKAGYNRSEAATSLGVPYLRTSGRS